MMVDFWAPEDALNKFSRLPMFNKKDSYQLACIVLFEQQIPFKHRMNGKIVDDWITMFLKI